MKKESILEYEEHQRDYTLLGNSATFTFALSKQLTNYFQYQAKPMYLCIRNGLFYHYYSINDISNRAKNWYRIYDISELKKQHKKLKVILKRIKAFYDSNHVDFLKDIKQLYEGYKDILIASLISSEVPEYNPVSKEFLNICFEMRKEMEFVFKEGESLGKDLIIKAEKKHKLKPQTIENLTYKEFINYLENNVLPNNLKKRKTFVLVKMTANSDKIFFDRQKLDEIPISKNLNEKILKGQTAYKGKVRGKVKIVSRLSDSSKVLSGDILVASMTDPRYLPTMKRSAAIITDEGGITCHAAIVSRELKKPCIIGTKIATKVLKDGNEIEVNANKGIVRIIR